MTDYDSPWKEALEIYFQQGLALLLPHIHEKIDWSRPWEPLDKELQQIVHDAEQGRRFVDKLFKVWAKDGTETWVLLHIEVQTSCDPTLPRRIYVYNYRIDARYNHDAVSCVILADDDANWRPDSYQWELWGCRKKMDFPVVKLLDFAKREQELETSDNPFAQVILAHLKALETRGDDENRCVLKVQLVRGLCERGFSMVEIKKLHRLIDWLMYLPKEFDMQFLEGVKQFAEEKKMPFITTAERFGMDLGRREGLVNAIQKLLLARFDTSEGQFEPEIGAITDVDKLMAVLVAVGTATSLDEARRAWTK